MNSSVTPSQTQILLARYQWVRKRSEQLIEELTAEDCALQAAPFVSPAKWHLAHTTWFFETFILLAYQENYRVYDETFQVLFNSYYNGIGEQFPRPQRHILSRPNLKQVMHYRHDIDEQIISLLSQGVEQGVMSLLELGLNHEQQHQELLLMDIKYCFYQNPTYPAYSHNLKKADVQPLRPLEYIPFESQKSKLGHSPDTGFCFDNELPQHEQWLHSFSIANRLVSNGEYLSFIQDGGYDDPMLWLSDGWAWRQQAQASSPYYWQKIEGKWCEFTLYGMQALNPNQPVCHVNYYEAQAFAAWKGVRLPSEFEWELAAKRIVEMPHTAQLQPQYGIDEDWFYQAWQWTQSAYLPYPGFKQNKGAVGEYNGKFMINQMVLRGGCALTPEEHIRTSYRNFFYPQDAWPMTGIRLAKDEP